MAVHDRVQVGLACARFVGKWHSVMLLYDRPLPFQSTSIPKHDSNNNRMLASGFSNAPLSKYLVMAVVAASLLASITDSKHLFWIMVKPHISDYRQLWRCMTWPLLYTNSTEVLFSAMTLYQLRIIERLWGSRKFAVCPTTDATTATGTIAY